MRATDPEAAAAATQPTSSEIDRKPWKYVGIRGYSEFVASDDDFMIFRRFGSLNARVALALQDEISAMEEKLKDLDRRYSDVRAKDIHNGTFRGDVQDRSELMDDLKVKLTQYHEFLFQISWTGQFPVASKRDVESIKSWHFNHDLVAIAEEEQRYLDHDPDLINVLPRNKSAVRRALDKSLFLRTLAVWRYRRDDAPTHDRQHVRYFSDERMDRFSSVVTVLIGVMMLITPIWVLQATPRFQTKLIVITIFISVFLVAVAGVMTTKPFEALVATAGYAAVLMVFVQLDD